MNQKFITVLYCSLILSTLLFNSAFSQEISYNSKSINEFSNVFYDKDSTLFDFKSGVPILPNNKGKLKFYYATFHDFNPKKFEGSLSEASYITAFKFSNLKDCKEWCKQIEENPSSIVSIFVNKYYNFQTKDNFSFSNEALPPINENLLLKSEKKVYQYKNGVYFGDKKNDKAEGIGNWNYRDNNNKYYGEFLQGYFNGFGIYEDEQKNIYKGTFHYGDMEGYGKMTYSDGSIYEGLWFNSQRHGFGKMVYKYKSIYTGNWVKGMREGEGVIRFPNGEYYEGSWISDKYNGKGKYYVNGKLEYNGEWKNGTKEGYGEYSYSNGDFYKGTWYKDRFNGQGIMMYSDGTIYDGNWESGLRSGSGTLKKIDGSVYYGNWSDGKMNGYGRMCFKALSILLSANTMTLLSAGMKSGISLIFLQ